MNDNLDMDFSAGLHDGKTLQDMAGEVLEEILRVANGKKTKTEIYGFGYSETVVRRMCDYV